MTTDHSGRFSEREIKTTVFKLQYKLLALEKLACPHWAGVSRVGGVKKGRQDRFREVHLFEISWVQSLLLSGVLGPLECVLSQERDPSRAK